jgi:hypothetical protein
VYPEDRDPVLNVAVSVPREDNVRRVPRNNGLSAHPTLQIDLQSICDARASRARVAGMPRGGCSAPEHRSTTGANENLKERISMLDQTVSRIAHVGGVEPPVSQPVDRSMDVLQYATAFIAGLVALLLAVLH